MICNSRAVPLQANEKDSKKDAKKGKLAGNAKKPVAKGKK
jgi:hypothetical protein